MTSNLIQQTTTPTYEWNADSVSVEEILSLLKTFKQEAHSDDAKLEKGLVHKNYDENVLIGRTKQVRENLTVGEIINIRNHPFFYEHEQDHLPGLYIIEGIRQFGLASCHICCNVPLNARFVMNTLYSNFHRFAEHEYPVYTACQITNPTYDKKGNLNRNNFVIRLFQKEMLIADFTSSIQIYAPEKYEKIRKRMKRELER